ncbi:MAG: hypothetical protein JWQ71_1650 [Pedosphaera sp.]|nr:hypothetical protein [Pedosphaera sp.]
MSFRANHLRFLTGHQYLPSGSIKTRFAFCKALDGFAPLHTPVAGCDKAIDWRGLLLLFHDD